MKLIKPIVITAGDPAGIGPKICSSLVNTDLLSDIVVIGGIKKNVLSQSKNQTPGIGNVPVIGNLFKGKSNSDNLDELLVFIAPRIL